MTVGSMQETQLYSTQLPPWDRTFAQNNLPWQNQFQPIHPQAPPCNDQIVQLKNHLQQKTVDDAQQHDGGPRTLQEQQRIQEISRRTPEILEPRKSINEPDYILKKKVTPFKHNGVVAELPPINTFCKYQAYKRKGSMITKENGKLKKKSANAPVPTSCGCTTTDQEQSSGPFYTHLGSGKTKEALLLTLTKQLDVSPESIKIHMVTHTTTEGKNGDGCPLARWVVRRTSPEEKYMVIAKQNKGHFCDGTISVIALVAWEGISKQYADDLYQYITENLNDCGMYTRRRCGANDSKTCMCQGQNEQTQGASFTFGCSWSLYFDGCKFAKSKASRKFKMGDPVKEQQIEKVLTDMSTNVSPLLNIWAPRAFENMTQYEDVASDCRIGLNEGGRPFSGVTCCLDFCTHSHKDIHNMVNGTTMVCTLLRPGDEKDDEQLHVLPLYQLMDENDRVAPTNFEIPSHFLNSNITQRQEPKEGKGKYVCPTKVNNAKEGVAEKKDPLSCPVTFNDEGSVPQLTVQKNEWNFPATFPDQNMSQDNAGMPLMHPMFLPDNSTVEMFKNALHESATPLGNKMEKSGNLKKVELHSKETIITPDMGGVAIALEHGSFLIECAKKEVHATTSLRNPRRDRPTRLSMVFYQHKKLNLRSHGYHEYKFKMEKRKLEKQQEKQQEKQSFDDLALLATTASLNDSNVSMDGAKSCDNTPEKRNPLLELCKLESASEPNIPSLFPEQLDQKSDLLSTQILRPPFVPSAAHIPNAAQSVASEYNPTVNTLQPAKQHPNKNRMPSATHSPNANKFSIDTLINDTKQSQLQHCATVTATQNHGQRDRMASAMSVSKLPTFSIFSKTLPTSESDSCSITNGASRLDTNEENFKSNVNVMKTTVNRTETNAKTEIIQDVINKDGVSLSSNPQQTSSHSANENRASILSHNHIINEESNPMQTIPGVQQCGPESAKNSGHAAVKEFQVNDHLSVSMNNNTNTVTKKTNIEDNSVTNQITEPSRFNIPDTLHQNYVPEKSHRHLLTNNQDFYKQPEQQQKEQPNQRKRQKPKDKKPRLQQKNKQKHQQHEIQDLVQQHQQQQQQQILQPFYYQHIQQYQDQHQQQHYQQNADYQQFQKQQQLQQQNYHQHQPLEHLQKLQQTMFANTSLNSSTVCRENMQEQTHQHLLLQHQQQLAQQLLQKHEEPKLAQQLLQKHEAQKIAESASVSANTTSNKNLQHPRHMLMQSLGKAVHAQNEPGTGPNMTNEHLHRTNNTQSFHDEVKNNPHEAFRTNDTNSFPEMASASQTLQDTQENMSHHHMRNGYNSRIVSTPRNNEPEPTPAAMPPTPTEHPPISEWQMFHANLMQHVKHRQQYNNEPTYHLRPGENQVEPFRNSDLEIHRNQALLQKMAQLEQFRQLQARSGMNSVENDKQGNFRQPTLLDQHAAMWRHQYFTNPEN